MYDTNPTSLERWRLHGSLVTVTPMHIGDGGALFLKERIDRDNDLFGRADPKYASVFMGKTGPIIPGSSLKGALRAWALAHDIREDAVSSLFGTLKLGSALTVHDAVLSTPAKPWEESARFWCSSRSTSVSAHAVIDPRTRTAQEGLLFYTEYVPAESRFTATFTAQNIAERDRQLLVWLLDHAFQSTDRPARLGGNVANGWGEVKWEPEDVDVLKQAEIQAWLKNQSRGAGTHWTSALRRLSNPERATWLAVSQRPGTAAGTAPSTITIDLALSFSGAVLINDPARERRGVDGENAIGHVMIRKERDEYYLPSHSVRGAFRAQVRRIWQTLALAPANNRVPGLNLSELDEKQTLASRKNAQLRLSPFHKMMGAGGWRSPFAFEDFSLTSSPVVHLQHFVAIDRFTGAVAGSKKFQAEGLMRPVFSGKISVYPKHLENAQAGDWVWLMLLFVLRDWAEGDGCVGSGASKGYGAFQAHVAVSGADPADFLSEVLQGRAEAFADAKLAAWEVSLNSVMFEKAA